MDKKYSSNAMPIVAIVFSGVSIVLFLVQILFTASHYQIKNGYNVSDFLIMLLGICITTFISMFPAIFFIICASKYISGKKNNFLMISLIMVCVSSLLLAVNRIVSKSNIFDFSNLKRVLPDYIIILLYSLIIVFCLVAIIKLKNQKPFKTFAILAAATGLLIIALMMCFNAVNILTGVSFDFNSLFKAGIRILSDVLYEAAFIFLYISLIFITLPYGKYKRIKVTLKSSGEIEK